MYANGRMVEAMEVDEYFGLMFNCLRITAPRLKPWVYPESRHKSLPKKVKRINDIISAFPPPPRREKTPSDDSKNVLGLKLNLNILKTHEHNTISSRLVSLDGSISERGKKNFLAIKKTSKKRKSGAATTTPAAASALKTNFSLLIEI